jgi:HEAT repeat protein
MARRTRAATLDAKIEALRHVKIEKSWESATHLIEEALKDDSWLVVSEAAEMIVQQGLRDFAAPLLQVWPRFRENAAKRDPGCRAKEAALKALDYLELLDPEPFLAAIRYKQFEPSSGGRVDTAGGVRVRALMALLRMVHTKAALYAGELLADPDPQVRAGVARAIGYYEDRNSLGLLVYKLRAGDEDPVVLLECAGALLTVELEFGLNFLVPYLSGSDEVRQETAALALGQDRDPKATLALLEWLEHVAFDRDHELGIRALGLSRHDQSRRYLLKLVEAGPITRARSAVEALSVHRYDPQLSLLVREAATKRGNSALSEFVERAFAEKER